MTDRLYPKVAPGGTQFDAIAQIIADEIEIESATIAERVFGNEVPGAARISEEELVEMVQRNAKHSAFLERLAVSIGPKKFQDVADKAGLYTGYKPEEPEEPMGPTFDDSPASEGSY